ncbi:TlpA family protein disulfide reductase [bacterium]|nr:TlpA family protein disulfide reductase [bacterium]
MKRFGFAARLAIAALWIAAPAAHAAMVGQAAPPFRAEDASGASVTSASYAGQVIVLNVWASWCAPCQQELPEMEQMAGRLAGANAVVLAVNIDDDRKAGERAAAKLHLKNVRTLFDSSKAVPKAFSVSAMPSTIIIAPDGVVRHVNEGYAPGDVAKMESVVRSLLKP